MNRNYSKYYSSEETAASYRQTRDIVQRAWELAEGKDKRNLARMRFGCDFVIEWMETGCMPGNKRGIERRARYEQEILMDPAEMCRLKITGTTRNSEIAARDKQELINNALQKLSPRERECFYMSVVDLHTQREIAELLGVSLGTVGTLMRRAKRKIEASQNL